MGANRPPRPPVTTLSPEGVWAEAVRHLPLVGHVAKGYFDRGVPSDDLIQEGVLGLRRAIELYDPARGVAFSTYAAYWIRQAMQVALEGQAHTIRAPRASRRPRVSNDAIALAAQTTSLDVANDGASVGDEIQARPDRIDPADLAEALGLLARLDPRSRLVVEQHLGLHGPTRYLSDIGKDLGLGRERVRQIYDAAIAEMRRSVA